MVENENFEEENKLGFGPVHTDESMPIFTESTKKYFKENSKSAFSMLEFSKV